MTAANSFANYIFPTLTPLLLLALLLSTSSQHMSNGGLGQSGQVYSSIATQRQGSGGAPVGLGLGGGFGGSQSVGQQVSLPTLSSQPPVLVNS